MPHTSNKYMVEENISLKFRLRQIDETRICFIEKIKQEELMSKKQTFCMALNSIKHLLF